MNDVWLRGMFAASVLGSLLGVFWPILISLWRVHHGNLLSRIRAMNVRLGGDPEQPRGTIRVLLFDYVFPIFGVVVLGIIVAAAASALGFFAFLQEEETRKKLQELGSLSYFSAFTYGFGAASLIEEAAKQN